MTLQIGIFLALLCALATNVGFLFKHRGACAAPDVDVRRPVTSAIGLFKSKWFTIGMLVAVGAWILHVGALALAPLSLVQAVLAGGLVLLTVLAERFFGHSVGKRQWIGVGLTALGLTLLAVTLPSHSGSHSRYSTARLLALRLLHARHDRVRVGAAHGGHPAGAEPALGRSPRAPRRASRHRSRNLVRGIRRGHQGPYRNRGRCRSNGASLALAPHGRGRFGHRLLRLSP